MSGSRHHSGHTEPAHGGRPAALGLVARLLVGMLAGLMLAAPMRASAQSFLHVSDIHFDPFGRAGAPAGLLDAPIEGWPALFTAEPQPRLPAYGEDTNAALLQSALSEIARAGAEADFVLLSGDLLAHRFPDKVEQAFGFASGSAESRDFAARTTLYVLDRLAAALPEKPILVALGNTDAGCGDYRIDPGGSYLEATRETVRRLAGPGRLTDDFDASYGAGGYYAAAHPTLADTTILVLDDAMWAADYRNACGSTGLDGAYAMLDWLESQLAAAKDAGRKVWLMHHIPAGIDAFGTLQATGADCRARIVPMLAEPFASRFDALLGSYGATVTASFSGHDHHDDYRLLRDAAGTVTGMEKLAPAISPIFGQNPGFHIFGYDRAGGAVTGFTTYSLANLATAADPASAKWRPEYAFPEAYGVAGDLPGSVEAMWKRVMAGGDAAATFARLYNVGHGLLGPAELPAYACAVGHTDAAGFAACWCGG